MNNVESEVYSKLISPIKPFFDNNPYKRTCGGIPDEEWIQMGVERVIGENKSGRVFLQKQFFRGAHDIHTGLYFESLKSERRLNHLAYLNSSLALSDEAWDDCEDPFAKDCPELDDYVINHGDGHYHESPVHEQKINGKTYGTQHFYAKNARSQMMWHIALAEYGEDRKKEHDMRMLKRQNIDVLRAGAAKGKKSLWIWDRACMSFPKWFEWKRNGIYFLTLEKELNEFTHLSSPEFDKNDEINFGVIKDQKVSAGSSKQVLRRVTYRCPDTRKTYRFVTNLPFKIRPGVVAFLYKCRWDIEKTYNTFKHKFYERKAWAVSITAKVAQANFLCLAHNLTLIMNRKINNHLDMPENSPNTKARKRKVKRVTSLQKKCLKYKRAISELLLNAKRLAEIPIKFLVWIEETIQIRCSWKQAIALLERSCVNNS